MKKLFSLLVAGVALACLMFTSFGQVAPPRNGNGNVPERKIVVFMDHVAPAAQDAMIQRAGAAKIKNLSLVNAAVVMATPAAERALAGANGVAWIENDAVVMIDGQVERAGKPGGGNPPPPAQVVPSGISRIGAPAAWQYATGLHVNVAVVDTGIDLTHQDLVVAGGFNAISSRKTANDDNGHGSHVAGTIAARNNAIGVVGVAPDANLYAVKVLDSQGAGWVSDCIEGIQWCINTHYDSDPNNDIQVINMSFSTVSDRTADVATFAAALTLAADNGILMVAAAGNDGAAVSFPASHESVIAVSALSGNTIASFSNRGPEVELAAPGVAVYSTYKGGDYASMSGTSMAAPHVTGVVALILQLADENTDVRGILQSTADDLGAAGKDDLYGFGLVDADGAVAPPQP